LINTNVETNDLPIAGFRWWGAGAQTWWEAPCADIESLGMGWPMKTLVFPRIINIYDAVLRRHIC